MAINVLPFGELFAEPTRNGLTRPKAQRGYGVKMVNMGELFSHSRIYNVSMDRVSLSKSEVDRFLLKEGDLLFARQSLVLEGAGKCALFLKDHEPVTFESHVTRVRLDPHIADPLFYFYYLQSPHGRAAIHSIVEQGAGVSGIRGSDLEKLNVQWYPVNEQRAIAHILGILDDKIELNRKMNETLEAMARAIFKSWFIDFDPVHAKAQVRDPKLPKEIADLFPDSFQNSELGKIPKGWRAGALGEICKVAIGGDWGKDHPFDDCLETLCLRGVDLKYLRETGNTNVPIRYIKKQSFDKRKMNEQDILIAASGLGPLGRSLWISKSFIESFELPVSYSNFCQKLSANNPYIAVYIDRILFNMRIKREIWEYATGTALPNLDINGLLKGKIILIPPEIILEKYYTLIKPIAAKLYNKENILLSKLRDTLLPKLLSGEIRVKDTEKFLETAI